MEKSILINGHTIKFDHAVYVSFEAMAAVLAFVLAVRLLNFLSHRLARGDWSPEETLRHTTRRSSFVGFLFSTTLWCAMAAAWMVALSEPYEESAQIQVPEGSMHVMVNIDESPSEAAEYYRRVLPTPALPDGTHPPPVGPWGSNEQVMRYLITEKIMPKIPGNKIGIVAFTSDARVVSQLREDYGTLRWMLTQTDWVTAPGGGSDPSEALSASIQALQKGIRKTEDLRKRQVIFIFSDGGITDIEPKQDSGKIDEEARAIWERDFARTLKNLAALKSACLAEGGEEPLVVLVGVGGETEERVPLYWSTGERVRDEKGELQWFPFGTPADKAPRTKFNEKNLLMLKDRIQAVTACRYQRVPLDWQAIEKIEWVKDVIQSSHSAVGKRYWTDVVLDTTMVLLALIFALAIFHRSDEIPLTIPRSHSK